MFPALEIMHIVGYVHRDVSAGNILFWNGTGVLSDLESAKKTTDLSTHEVRTVR
jgi:serine/threonine-protein kinase RIO1